jgi:hypothetical protein
MNDKGNNAVHTRYEKMLLVEDYGLNIKMILAMQQLGCGMAGATVLVGLLSICNNPLNGTWTQLEENLGKTRIELGKDIIDEKVQEEKKLSETDERVDRGRSVPKRN